MKVRFTPTGRSQFLRVASYIQQENPRAAFEFWRRAERILRRLERFPESGKAIREFPELPYREVIVTPYRFFYRIEGDIVWVVAVWHGAQLPDVPD